MTNRLLLSHILIITGLISGCASKDDDSGSNKAGTIEGTWKGKLQDTYYCEGTASPLEISISGNNVTVVSGDVLGANVSGTITQQNAQSFELKLTSDTRTLSGTVLADKNFNYLTIATIASTASDGDIGIFYRSDMDVVYTINDIVGEWSGTGVYVDSNFSVTESFDSNITVTNDGSIQIQGTDTDGSFAGDGILPAIALEQSFDHADSGVFVSGAPDAASTVVWSSQPLDGLYVMSPDKKAIAVNYLISNCGGGVYNQTNLPIAKFEILTKP